MCPVVVSRPYPGEWSGSANRRQLDCPFPKSNYEVRFDASRIEGGDFFANLTVPAGHSSCTCVTGGRGAIRKVEYRLIPALQQ